MKNSLYNSRHLKEYLVYGLIAGILYIIPSWIFFSIADYNETYIVFFGSIIFMFVIMFYVYKLSRRRTEYKSAWMMIIAAHMAILVGIAVSVLLTLLLCFVYIPGFFSGESTSIIADAPAALNRNNSDIVVLLLTCATVESFGAAGFMAVLAPYVFKINQTKDKTAALEASIPRKQDASTQKNYK
jgi:hypothetical protein